MRRRDDDPWTRPLTLSDCLYLCAMWLTILAVILVSIKLFDW